MARTYNRDSRGRFASGGGSGGGGGRKSSSSGGGRSKPAAKPPTAGRRGPRGGKVGTRAEQQRNARAQQERTRQFHSKAAVSAVKEAWKEASGRARKLRGKAAELRRQGNALMSGSGNRDTAITNVPLSSRARSSTINAGLRGLEMTRRADQFESRARGVEIRATRASRPRTSRTRQPAVSLAAKIASGEVTLKNAQAKRGEQRLTTLWSRRMNSSPSKRLKAEETKRRAQSFYNTRGRTWRERKPATPRR